MTFSNCNFTEETLRTLLPRSVDAAVWFAALDENLNKYQITTKQRVAAFLAQTFIESGKFTILQENLNYSSQSLIAVFPSHFNIATANIAAHNPTAIANVVYANRMGNNNAMSGDGWLFRGRGIIQITGRYMYTLCSHDLYNDDRLVQNPDQLLQPENAVLAACWFWTTHDLNTYADNSDMVMITKRINGGTNLLDQRLAQYKAILASL